MKTLLFSLALCLLLQLQSVSSNDSSADTNQQANAEDSNDATLSRMKRTSRNMMRIGRGIQMLRLGKRQIGEPSIYFPDDPLTLDDLEDDLQSRYYDEEDRYLPIIDDAVHARYRRSADPSQEAAAAEPLFVNSATNSEMKRSVDELSEPLSDEDAFLTEPFEEDTEEIAKRPMSMLRLGKRPMSMLRLGKRPMSMLRLGKRPMSMLRLGKRPMSMLRLGKRPMSMLRLGKRPMSMLRLGKRPMSMLRLGKRPMSMLRLGKRPMSMLRLGKRPMSMLRLGKRPMSMLRLGKRESE